MYNPNFHRMQSYRFLVLSLLFMCSLVELVRCKRPLFLDLTLVRYIPIVNKSYIMDKIMILTLSLEVSSLLSVLVYILGKIYVTGVQYLRLQVVSIAKC